MISDSAAVSELDDQGFISSRRVVAVSNAEVQLDLTAKHVGGASYSFSGTSSGKALSGTFKTRSPRGLESDVIVDRAVKDELLTSRVKQLDVELYLPDLNPTAPTPFVIKGVASAPRVVQMDAAALKMVTVDANGDEEASELHLGPVTLRSARAFVEGSPW